MTIDLTPSEAAAMLMLLKIGMDTYEGDPIDDEAFEILRLVPNPVLYALVGKVGVAAGKAEREMKQHGL